MIGLYCEQRKIISFLVHSEHLDTIWIDALGITNLMFLWRSTAVSCELKSLGFTRVVMVWMRRFPEG